MCDMTEWLFCLYVHCDRKAILSVCALWQNGYFVCMCTVTEWLFCLCVHCDRMAICLIVHYDRMTISSECALWQNGYFVCMCTVTEWLFRMYGHYNRMIISPVIWRLYFLFITHNAILFLLVTWKPEIVTQTEFLSNYTSETRHSVL
jgi:hypothetical protein